LQISRTYGDFLLRGEPLKTDKFNIIADATADSRIRRRNPIVISLIQLVVFLSSDNWRAIPCQP
jgi:hypothetical protein